MTIHSTDSLDFPCCICNGKGTRSSVGSAYLNLDGNEHRVYYHKSCLNEKTKQKVVNVLNEMAKK